MTRIRLGQVEYINCLPVYYALEDGLLVDDIDLVKGPPTKLNKMFLDGDLDVTPISSIEYARNRDKCIILPNLSISADGKVESILFFSRIPLTELEGKKVCVTTSSATSVALLRILFEHYYHVKVEFCRAQPDLDAMLATSDGALLIGDDAMRAHHRIRLQNRDLVVTDLGEAWKSFTGEKMVYAVWVIRSSLAEKEPYVADQISKLLYESKLFGLAHREALIKKAHRQSQLPYDVLDHYLDTIHHDLSEDERRAMLTYFDYAYKSGIIEERVKLRIWGE
ncbi:menaquinone biosynthesis protein [Desulfallas sp. Bu1-1]|uniref:menaquinone biosynthetic enzyme MqnA/MqnD family protein n=1 Tax=Desulfallas sp. Bu1-1 TaxID=2787620 RepID=UPI00189FF337|nr:menaquinone biosynthesis protein [Desulfallas sp. Bu1-1]MBF7084102.1 menaquinone biosynthesis protein [Desulfallas sp. Bu1-1]